jgi:hypothetical protein
VGVLLAVFFASALWSPDLPASLNNPLRQICSPEGNSLTGPFLTYGI